MKQVCLFTNNPLPELASFLTNQITSSIISTIPFTLQTLVCWLKKKIDDSSRTTKSLLTQEASQKMAREEYVLFTKHLNHTGLKRPASSKERRILNTSEKNFLLLYIFITKQIPQVIIRCFLLSVFIICRRTQQPLLSAFK